MRARRKKRLVDGFVSLSRLRPFLALPRRRSPAHAIPPPLVTPSFVFRPRGSVLVSSFLRFRRLPSLVSSRVSRDSRVVFSRSRRRRRPWLGDTRRTRAASRSPPPPRATSTPKTAARFHRRSFPRSRAFVHRANHLLPRVRRRGPDEPHRPDLRNPTRERAARAPFDPTAALDLTAAPAPTPPVPTPPPLTGARDPAVMRGRSTSTTLSCHTLASGSRTLPVFPPGDADPTREGRTNSTTTLAPRGQDRCDRARGSPPSRRGREARAAARRTRATRRRRRRRRCSR